jgi:hypothetical protein
MDPHQERSLNQSAYRRLRETIQEKYQPGQFLAISGGQVIADAGSFEDLRSLLQGRGEDPRRVLIVQAGTEYPETAVIFTGSEAGK